MVLASQVECRVLEAQVLLLSPPCSLVGNLSKRAFGCSGRRMEASAVAVAVGGDRVACPAGIGLGADPDEGVDIDRDLRS